MACSAAVNWSSDAKAEAYNPGGMQIEECGHDSDWRGRCHGDYEVVA
jgi:hypothetical protein